MKFQQVVAFEKHFQSSLQLSQPAKVYLLLYPQREERKKLMERMLGQFRAKYLDIPVFFCDTETATWPEVLTQLNTQSLFSLHEVVVWDGVKSLNAQQKESFVHYVSHPSDHAFLFIGAESFKDFSDLYNELKQELVVLDLSDEKPWDKQKRLQQELVVRAHEEGKKITADAVDCLLSHCGNDAVTLESELQKCICYVGDHSVIHEQDVLAIGSSSQTANGWQVAEELAWGTERDVPLPSIDLSFFLALLGQLRYQLLQGRQMELHLQKGAGYDEMAKIFPIVRQMQLRKMITGMQRLRIGFFREVLEVLFSLELLAKNSALSPSVLFDLLFVKLTYLKQAYGKKKV